MIRIILILIILFLTSCISTRSDIEPNILSESGLGKELIFPGGWTPILFTSLPVHGTGYVFICENDNRYRYCSPSIKE